MEEAATWFDMLATATAGGIPRNTSTGVIRNPPPMPNMPETKPTSAPSATSSGAFTESSAIGR